MEPRYPPRALIHFSLTVFILTVLFFSKLHPQRSRNEIVADRLHVWHMKVLLYAVFKDREDRRLARIASFEYDEREARFVPSKLNSAIP